MNFSQLFIKRPVMTTLLMIAIVVFGLVGYRFLPIAELPNVDFPTILVTANLPGASPETMASAVATPLEREFSTISGLKSMNSVNAKGITQITLEFDLNRDIDAAAQDVQTAIARAARQLTSNMPTPPTYNKVKPADMPIVYFAITSPAEVDVDVSQDPNRLIFDRSKPFYIKGTLTTVVVPFEGDAELFYYRPSTFSLLIPQGKFMEMNYT